MRRYTSYLTVALVVLAICFSRLDVEAQTVSIRTRDNTNLKIYCTDKDLLLVWDEIRNEFRGKSTEDLTKLGGNNCKNLFEVKQIVDLNSDSTEELFIYNTIECSATINCRLWIFQKKKNKFQAIFKGNEIERFALEKTKTKDYSDIQLRTHNTGTSHYFQTLKFDGKNYKAQKCRWEDSAIPDKKGDFYLLKKPQIRFVRCGGYSYADWHREK